MPHLGELNIETIINRLQYQHQLDAILNQTNPVSGAIYTVLPTTRNVRLISIAARCTWTVQPTPLEVHLTIDGQAITAAYTNPVSVTAYYYRNIWVAGADLAVWAEIRWMPYILEGRSIGVQAEITGGTVSNLYAIVKYARIP